MIKLQKGYHSTQSQPEHLHCACFGGGPPPYESTDAHARRSAKCSAQQHRTHHQQQHHAKCPRSLLIQGTLPKKENTWLYQVSCDRIAPIGAGQMINGKRVVVVMPAYNAASTLERTVRELPEIVDATILVDDKSTD